MVQVDLPAAFAIGQIFAFLSRDYLRRETHLFSHRLLGPLNLYLACCYAPVGMFLLVGWPAWEVMYRSSWVEQPYGRPWVAGFYVLFAVAMVLLGNLGFVLGHRWLRAGRDRWVVRGAAAGVVLTFLPFLLRWGVWWRVGTLAEIEAGAGDSFWQPPFFTGWLTVMSYFAVTLVLAGWWMRHRGNHLQPC
jgi:hypothetical protein